MAKNLVMRRFSNFNSSTVRETKRLEEAWHFLLGVIDDPLFRTRIGKSFSFEKIEEVMAYEATPGGQAILLPNGC